MRPATDAAFSMALIVTFAGSTTPVALKHIALDVDMISITSNLQMLRSHHTNRKFSYFPVAALYPNPNSLFLHLSDTTAPGIPALTAI